METGEDFSMSFQQCSVVSSFDVPVVRELNLDILLVLCLAASEWVQEPTRPTTPSLAVLFRFYGEGRIPGSSQNLELDKTAPVREMSPSIVMFRELVMNKSVLTAPTGVGGFLWVTKTCQGPKTQAFYQRVGFPSTKEDLLNAYRTWSPSEGAADDQSFFGASSHDLCITDSQNFNGSEDHFAKAKHNIDKFYSKEVVDGWLELLGTNVGDTLKENRNPNRKWSEARAFLKTISTPKEEANVNGARKSGRKSVRKSKEPASHITGYKGGLMGYHAANLLAYVGIVEPATLDDVEQFVGATPLGAASALKTLGFTLSTASDRRAAFRLVFLHLSRHLSEDQKKSLRFSPTFVEHILCKLTRFLNACDTKQTVMAKNVIGLKLLRRCAEPFMVDWHDKGALQFNREDLFDSGALGLFSSGMSSPKTTSSPKVGSRKRKGNTCIHDDVDRNPSNLRRSSRMQKQVGRPKRASKAHADRSIVETKAKRRRCN